MVINNAMISFNAKQGENFILSMFVMIPNGLDDPFWCNKIKWIITSAAIISGSRKCNEKNRFNVGWDTEKFPQTHWVICFPMQGIAEIILVITVAPQNDICPQGRTYPIKAVAIDIIIIITPDIHTRGFFLGELK